MEKRNNLFFLLLILEYSQHIKATVETTFRNVLCVPVFFEMNDDVKRLQTI